MSKQAENRLANVLTLLDSSGLKNNEFSARIGVMPSYFTQIKRGRAKGGRDIGDALAKRIEEAFELKEFWLDRDFSASDEDSETLSENQRALLRICEKLTPDQIKLVLAFSAGITATND
jgi:transcriptional regulator with XRE-family HTH domain